MDLPEFALRNVRLKVLTQADEFILKNGRKPAFNGGVAVLEYLIDALSRFLKRPGPKEHVGFFQPKAVYLVLKLVDALLLLSLTGDGLREVGNRSVDDSCCTEDYLNLLKGGQEPREASRKFIFFRYPDRQIGRGVRP